MIYITGDTHGDLRSWEEEIVPVLAADDTIIIAGDFGIGFWGDGPRTEEDFFDAVAEQDYTVLFIDGNHENFDQLEQYPLVSWNGGTVHQIRHNLLHLMRGEVYIPDGIRLFAFGGGYSADRHKRKPGVSWWHQEMPSQEEFDNGYRNLERFDFQVDYVVTHTAPCDTLTHFISNPNSGVADRLREEMPLNNYLESIREQTQYTQWYFGHLHIDTEMWRRQTAVFTAIRELESGKIIRERTVREF